MLARRLRSGRVLGAILALSVIVGFLVPTASAGPAQGPTEVRQDLRFTASDGVEIAAKLGGVGPLIDGKLPPRPTIVEFTPYNQACCPPGGGDSYNYLMVHIRGTGASDGVFDALGPRTQADVVEVLQWACEQPWTNGRLGLYGFSASAITVYNSLHQELPCVDTAVLGAGTHELYRDLLYPGGVPNIVPGAGVLVGIGGPTQANLPDRLQRNPASIFETLGGMFDVGLDYLIHPTLDWWWTERGMRGNVNDWPVLLINGFYDVESRGPFEAFNELKGNGSHLLVIGAHEGVPAGTTEAHTTRVRWYDRYLRDEENGVDLEPAVQLWLSDGDREDMLAGRFLTAQAEDWPVPGTTWTALALDPRRSGTATSLNDGTLSLVPPATATIQSYPSVPSLPTATDLHTTALLGFFNDLAGLTDMTLAEPLGLSYTTAPLAADVVAAGPASLEVVLSTTSPEADIYAVVSDVSPDGVAHPVATGRLRTSFPHVDESRSRIDPEGNIVQPYGRFDRKDPATIGAARRYHVELWPIGNRFRAGHRIRLHIVGAPAFSLPSVPGLSSIRVGGPEGSRLLLPVLPGDVAGGADLVSALPATSVKPAPGADPDADLGPAPAGDASVGLAPLATTGRSGGARLPATGASVPTGVAVGLLAAALLGRRLVAGR